MAISLTKEQWFGFGLEVAEHPKWRSYKKEANEDRWREAFGCNSDTCYHIWEDLRNSTEGLDDKAKPLHLLIAIRFLWRYESEADLCKYFKIRSKVTISKWWKHYVLKIEKLLDPKMGTLEENDDGYIYFISIDGVHCSTNEPRPFSTWNSDFKAGGKPGVNYELGILINKPKLVWVEGPTQPGKETDLMVFRRKLMPELASLEPRENGAHALVVADGIYKPESKYVSTKNDLDPPDLRLFKNRVSARHENFNGFIKNFKCTRNRFKHGHWMHGMCFRGVCTILSYSLECGGHSLLDPYP